MSGGRPDAVAGSATAAAVVATGAALGWVAGAVAGQVAGRFSGGVAGSPGSATVGARCRARSWRGPASAAAALASAPAAVAYGRAVARSGPYQGPKGAARLAVDVTWSALNTWAGALHLAGHLAAGHHLDEARSRGTGALWVREGTFPGYATTVGIVKAGSSEAVDAHEMVHVFQARLLGPLYLPSVAANYVVATVVPYWWWWRDRDRWPVTGFATYFLHGVYPHTWHEAWAYATDRRRVPPADFPPGAGASNALATTTPTRRGP